MSEDMSEHCKKYVIGKGVLYNGDTIDVTRSLPSNSVNTIVTSPPYWGMRDYGVGGQIGLEPTLNEYHEHLLELTAELKRVLREDGLMFWNHGNSYATTPKGNKNWESMEDNDKSKATAYRMKKEYGVPLKSLTMQNYRLAIRMVDEQGWILRNTIIWNKPNHMPSSVKDRFSNSYEPVFLFSKSKRYWSDLDAVRVPYDMKRWGLRRDGTYQGKAQKDYESAGAENPSEVKKRIAKNPHPLGKNPSDVWEIPTASFHEAHFAVFPERLIEPMIKFGCPEGGTVYDPFMGAGTTALVAEKLNRRWIGAELNPDYVEIIKKRLSKYDGQKRIDEGW